jgi:phage FluMu protein Com
MELQKIRCPSCGNLLLKSFYGEIEIPCDRCKKMVHVIVTSKGIIDLTKPVRLIDETVIK